MKSIKKKSTWRSYKVCYEVFDYNRSGEMRISARTPQEAETKMKQRLQNYDLAEMIHIEDA